MKTNSGKITLKPVEANTLKALLNHQKLALKTARRNSIKPDDDPLVGMLEACMAFAESLKPLAKPVKTMRVDPRVAYELAQMDYHFLAPATFDDQVILANAKARVKNVGMVTWDVADVKSAADCANLGEISDSIARRALRYWEKTEDTNFASIEKAVSIHQLTTPKS